MKWSKEEFEKAKKLVIDGFRFHHIAEELNRSVDSVRNKMNKSGVKFSEHNSSSEDRSCLECKCGFEVNKSNPKKFCCKSCGVSYNNRKRKKFNNCTNCKEQIDGNKKYCNNKCQQEFQRKEIFDKIEKGEYTTEHTKIYKTYLISIHGEKCMECGWKEVNKYSGKIPLELHHVDCNPDNNKVDNLQILCPNHHALTKSWKAISEGDGRYSRRRKRRRKNYKEGKSW